MNGLLIVLALLPLQDPPKPDEKETRAKIDALIAAGRGDKKKANLGMLREAIELSISFGAPAYNEGDHEACARFYSRTCESLTSAFAEEGSAGASARPGLANLKSALDHAAKFDDVDRKAWALRYGFDKTLLAWQVKAAAVKGLESLGNEGYLRGHFEEAEETLREACEALEELVGADPSKIDADTLLSPLILGHVFFARGKFKEASRSILQAAVYSKDLPKLDLDRRSSHPRPKEYDELLEKLRGAAQEGPDDADLQFLLGYELYFGGKKEDSKECFRAALKLAPNHAGARLFRAAMSKDY